MLGVTQTAPTATVAGVAAQPGQGAMDVDGAVNTAAVVGGVAATATAVSATPQVGRRRGRDVRVGIGISGRLFVYHGK